MYIILVFYTTAYNKLDQKLSIKNLHFYCDLFVHKSEAFNLQTS